MNAYELMRADQLLDELQPDFPQEVELIREQIDASVTAEEHYRECECISEDDYDDVIVAVDSLVEELAAALGLEALTLYAELPQDAVLKLNAFRLKVQAAFH